MTQSRTPPGEYRTRLIINNMVREVDELRGTVEDLERTVEQQADEIEQLRKDREDAFDTFLDRFENKLNGEYKTMIEQSIKSDLQLDNDHE